MRCCHRFEVQTAKEIFRGDLGKAYLEGIMEDSAKAGAGKLLARWDLDMLPTARKPDSQADVVAGDLRIASRKHIDECICESGR